LKAPIPRPGKIITIGLNYRDHAAEGGLPAPEAPIVFAKYPSAVVGSGEAIQVRPDISAEVDYEAELVVVIGREAKDVPVEEALGVVFGYACGNDVSARDVPNGDQWMYAKSFDTFAPLGPWIVTADEIPDPQTLTVEARLNGEVMQSGSTKEMIFSVAELIAYVSRGLTLLPGDLIYTGTPAGVGMARTPPVWLKPGDTIEVEIERIGVLRNPVV
jgi:2-keto-4-pentenoate hydratase/2-oxohepta-3-ene-1,7-dioic acid hydratase in catechol pathway